MKERNKENQKIAQLYFFLFFKILKNKTSYKFNK